MNVETYRFKVGALECMVVSDGTYLYNPPVFPPPSLLLFANAPEKRLHKALREHNIEPERWLQWESPYLCLVINNGRDQVLVDTGAGDLAPSTGNLLQNLQAEGIAGDEIDVVILTHGHPDHIGGNTDNQGKSCFPKARFVMWKDEWDFWTSDQPKLKFDEHVRATLLAAARKNLAPIRDQVNLIDRETEIVPGIGAVKAQGHTSGHMALHISSQDEQLLCIADALLHPIHAERPNWHSVFDLDPKRVEITRRRLLHRAASERALVLAFHFPFPGLGYVVQKGEQWEWRRI